MCDFQYPSALLSSMAWAVSTQSSDSNSSNTLWLAPGPTGIPGMEAAGPLGPSGLKKGSTEMAGYELACRCM